MQCQYNDKEFPPLIWITFFFMVGHTFLTLFNISYKNENLRNKLICLKKKKSLNVLMAEMRMCILIRCDENLVVKSYLLKTHMVKMNTTTQSLSFHLFYY